MREVKFRAWHEEHEEMVYFLPEKLKRDQYQAHHLAKLMAGDYGDVLMQFTGLKDKNGVDIYEGDVLGQSGDVIAPVTFKDGSFQVIAIESQGRSPLCGDRSKNFEIIGNIHEDATK